VKRRVAQLLDTKLIEDEAFSKEWYGLNEKCFPASDCGILMTQLVGQAWEDL
jgi:hypothetical protein